MSKHTIPTEINIAPRGKSWLNGHLIDGVHGHPTRQSMENAESAQPNKTSATVATPVDRKDLVPGVMRCAKCEFQLVRQVLAVDLGEVLAGDSKTEPCPNDCGPLWPVTWKQYAEQAMDAAESMADRAFAAEKEVKQLRGELSALSTPNLRAKIMSTPLGLYGTGIGDIGIAFRAGHRAALLTAADLVASTVVAAPAAVAVPDERAAFEAWAKSEDMGIGSDCDGYIHSNTAAASLAWQARAALAATPAAVPTYIEVRECSECGHIGINDADGSKAACSKCDWQGDSPVEDKCPDCNTVGTMTAACSNCGARASLLAETTLHAEPIAPAAAAPVVLPEPFTTLVRKNSWSPSCYEASPRSNSQEYGRQWADERINVHTEQQVRALLAGISAPAAVAVAVPDGWREKFAADVYADLAAADNQDVPLEEYPARILKVLDSIVGPRHPVVIKWRNDAIRNCIAIAYKYCRDPESHKYLKQDLEAMLTTEPAPQAQADARDAEQEVLMEHSGCGSNTQVDMLTVRLNPGDKVVMHKGRITQGFERANRAAIAAAKGE